MSDDDALPPVPSRYREGFASGYRKAVTDMTDTSRSPLVSDPATASREFLFEYRFGGCDWVMKIHANDAAEAREKIRAVSMARYKGEVHATIHTSIPGAGLFVRALCWWRNR